MGRVYAISDEGDNYFIELVFEVLMLRKSIVAIRASSTETAAPTLP